MPPAFIPGIELSRRFFHEAVKPILSADYPRLPYSAALIGYGSEVLGFDTPMSTDHDWGPRLQLFLLDQDWLQYKEELKITFRSTLPSQVGGFSTHFTPPRPDGTRTMESPGEGAINHKIEIWNIRAYLGEYLGFSSTGSEIQPEDWLSFPQQKLLALTSGAVYHDQAGLQNMRTRFAWYPSDVWLYLLASAWARIGQEEHLVGRAGYVGDELGSALMGGRLARDLMRLAFLMEKRYAPYPKWFGSAFQKLGCASRLDPHLQGAVHAANWQARLQHLARAYEIAAEMHNALGITAPVADKVELFYGRPFTVIWGEHFANALRARIVDEKVKALAARALIGSIDLLSDNTDLLEDSNHRIAVAHLFL